MKYEVTKLINKVYHVCFDNRYDLCMFFLRYAEYYESPNPQFRGKPFEILDFMEWYSKDRKGYFSYPGDWVGFNIPSKVINELNACGIFDKNKYDYEMIHLHRKLQREASGDYYLIGSAFNKEDEAAHNATVDHELAHGMYYTIPLYKKQVDKLTKKLDRDFYNEICDWLKEIGYTKRVYKDETQAYLATGLSWHRKTAWKKISKPFAKLFKEFKDEAIRNTLKS